MEKETVKKLVIGIAVGLVFVTAIGSYFSARVKGTDHEKGIKYEWKNNQNVLSTYHLKVKEAVQIPKMYANDFKELITAAIKGKYGENGSQATMQWMKDNNINLDASMYKKIQNIIEAGRDEFKIAQKKLLDRKMAYETDLEYPWSGFWLGMASYPRVDLDNTLKFRKIYI